MCRRTWIIALAWCLAAAGCARVPAPYWGAAAAAWRETGDRVLPGTRSLAEVEVPPLGQFIPPKATRHVLPNQMVVYLLEDHDLPLVDLTSTIRSGSVYDPSDKVGLAQLTAEVMRTGGSSRSPGDQIDEELESMAASVEVSMGLDSAGASLSCLKEDFDAVLAIFADILQNPAFPDDKLELAKKQMRSVIKRRNDEPHEISSREFRKLVYGAKSPYGWTIEYETINAVRRDDLIRFHQRFFSPNALILGAWGDFDSAEMLKKLEAAFSAWSPGTLDAPEVPFLQNPAAPGLYDIERKELNQTTLRLGHLGCRRDAPDYPALVVANEILGGGGFSSRLMRNVRSDQGLAYSVYSAPGAGYARPEIFTLYCQTKSESTVAAIESLLRELDQLTVEEVTEEELKAAKESILNSFIFNYDTKGEIVSRHLRYEYYGYPQDFAEQLVANIPAVTAADVLASARAHFHRAELRILSVGNSSSYQEALARLGSVETIALEKPRAAPNEDAAPQSPADEAKANELVRAAIQALGGEGVLRSLKDISLQADLTVPNPQGGSAVLQLAQTVLYPDRLRVAILTPMGKVVQTVSPEEAWIRTQQGVRNLPEMAAGELRFSLETDLRLLLLAVAADGKVARYKGRKTVGLAELDEIEIVAGPQRTVRIFLDPGTHLVAKEIVERAGGTREYTLSDYREVNGLRVPHKIDVSEEGEEPSSLIVRKVKINSGVSKAFFEKPSDGKASEEEE